MRIGEIGRSRGQAGRRSSADGDDLDRLACAHPLGQVGQLVIDRHELVGNIAPNGPADRGGQGREHHGRQSACQKQSRLHQPAGAAMPYHGPTRLPRSGPAAAVWGIGTRPMVLYQSIILAVRHIPTTPARLTASWMTMAEVNSESRKCPSAESRIPRQKISSDCWPQRTSGLAAAPRRIAASDGSKAATTTTTAQNGISRIGDKLFLLTGHRSFSRRPGNGSQTPWIVQLSLTTKPAATTMAATGSPTCSKRDHNRPRTPPSPNAAPAVNKSCQASGLKYQ